MLEMDYAVLQHLYLTVVSVSDINNMPCWIDSTVLIFLIIAIYTTLIIMKKVLKRKTFLVKFKMIRILFLARTRNLMYQRTFSTNTTVIFSQPENHELVVPLDTRYRKSLTILNVK